MEIYKLVLSAILCLVAITLSAQNTNPLWSQQKAKNYLPHMTYKEVEAFLEKSDMVIIPIGAIEQHSNHLPLGTDIINGVERCKLIAEQRDILVSPIIFPGQSPYHMGFAGTITLEPQTIVDIHMQAVKSLIKHGFGRFMIMSAHGGNGAIVKYIVDQINQTTSGVGVDFYEAVAPFFPKQSNEQDPKNKVLDRHAGTPETSSSMYLMPSLVQIEKAVQPTKLKLPAHLDKMVPQMLDGDPTAKLLFLSEGLKAEETGKKTSTAEMTGTGVWGERHPSEASVERGKQGTEALVNAAVQFIDKWNEFKID